MDASTGILPRFYLDITLTILKKVFISIFAIISFADKRALDMPLTYSNANNY